MRREHETLSHMAAAAAVFVAVFAYVSAGGLGFTYDSELYLYFATQMNLNGDFSTAVVYAPLYPALLALIMRAGADFWTAAALVAAGSLAAVNFFAARALSVIGAGLPLALTGGLFAAAIIFSESPFEWFWTEQIYAALLIAAAALTIRYLAGTRERFPWNAILVASALPAARYIGSFPMAVLLATLLLAYWSHRRFSIRALPALVLGGSLGSAVFAGIAVTHLAAGACVFGCRIPSTTGLPENVALTIEVLISDLRWYGAIFLVAALIAAAALRARPGTTVLPAILVPAVLIGVGVVAQIYASTSARIDPINTRYFAPYYPLMVVGATAALHAVTPRGARFLRSIALVAALAGAALAATHITIRGVGDWRRASAGDMLLTNTFPSQNPNSSLLRAELAAAARTGGIAHINGHTQTRNASSTALNPRLFPGPCHVSQMDPSPSHIEDNIAGSLECEGLGRVPILLSKRLQRVPAEYAAMVIANYGTAQIESFADENGYEVTLRLPGLTVLRTSSGSGQSHDGSILAD